jgi:hypothetical protein
MIELLEPNFRYLLDSYDWLDNPNEANGPPFYVSLAEIERLFGNYFFVF